MWKSFRGDGIQLCAYSRRWQRGKAVCLPRLDTEKGRNQASSCLEMIADPISTSMQRNEQGEAKNATFSEMRQTNF